MPFLDLQDLTFRYPGGGAPALDRLSLAVERGESIAVVGPNGAGKSTLARVVKGLLSCQAGRVLLAGEPAEPAGLPDRRVGLLFSNPENQMVTSVVEEDIAFGLEALALPPAAIRERVGEVIAQFALGPFRRSLPHRLSGGEQQRVALAGVLAPGPDLLLLDEPTAFLDPLGKEMLMDAIARLRGEGRTIISVTHDMEEAARADRVVVMAGGRVLAQGRPEEVFSLSRLVEQGHILPPFGVRLRRAWPRRPLPASARWQEMLAPLPPADRCGSTGSPGPEDGAPAVPASTGAVEVISARGLAFGYGEGREVLAGCDISLFSGELALLVGANGSGKSTLLTLLAGLALPDRGEVLCRGAIPAAGGAGGRAGGGKTMGGRAGRVGMVFQNPERQLFGETVAEDIAFGPRNIGVAEKDVAGRVAQAAALVELDPELLGRSPFHLSGGQQRRAALAGVLAMRPEALVLDEPADGLDPAGAAHLLAVLRSFARETGAAVLVASHAVPEQAGAFDRILVLAGGRIACAGDPASVFASRVLPEPFFPPHLRAQMALAARGYRLGGTALSVEEAVDVMVEAISG